MTRSGKRSLQEERKVREEERKIAQEVAKEHAASEAYRKARLASIGIIVK